MEAETSRIQYGSGNVGGKTTHVHDNEKTTNRTLRTLEEDVKRYVILLLLSLLMSGCATIESVWCMAIPSSCWHF